MLLDLITVSFNLAQRLKLNRDEVNSRQAFVGRAPTIIINSPVLWNIVMHYWHIHSICIPMTVHVLRYYPGVRAEFSHHRNQWS